MNLVKLGLVLFILVLLAGSVQAIREDLPITNIFDPEKSKNRPITDYTYEEIDGFMDYLSFRKWNDMDRVCESMEILFGKMSEECSDDHFVLPPGARPVTSRGYVTFEILPRPEYHLEVIPLPPLHVLVTPPPPPWRPVYNPYGPRW